MLVELCWVGEVSRAEEASMVGVVSPHSPMPPTVYVIEHHRGFARPWWQQRYSATGTAGFSTSAVRIEPEVTGIERRTPQSTPHTNDVAELAQGDCPDRMGVERAEREG